MKTTTPLNSSSADYKRKVSFGELNDLLRQEIDTHAGKLKGKSGKSPEWEEGFIAGMNQVGELLKQLRLSNLS